MYKRQLFILGLVLNVALIFGLCCLLFSKRLVYFLSTTVLRLLGLSLIHIYLGQELV